MGAGWEVGARVGRGRSEHESDVERVSLHHPAAERTFILAPVHRCGRPDAGHCKVVQTVLRHVRRDIANEFVDWFNEVDATYRSEFRGLSQAHFGQFDAKLEQRIGQLDAKLEQRVGELHAKIDRHVGELRTRIDQRIAEVKGELRTEMQAGFGALAKDLERQRADLLRWMFLYWAGSVVTTAGLVLTVALLLRG